MDTRIFLKANATVTMPLIQCSNLGWLGWNKDLFFVQRNSQSARVQKEVLPDIRLCLEGANIQTCDPRLWQRESWSVTVTGFERKLCLLGACGKARVRDSDLHVVKVWLQQDGYCLCGTQRRALTQCFIYEWSGPVWLLSCTCLLLFRLPLHFWATISFILFFCLFVCFIGDLLSFVVCMCFVLLGFNKFKG